MLWWLFNKPTTIVDAKFVILDHDGLITYIDDEYRTMGVEEGWLTFLRCIEREGHTVLIYRLK